MRDKVPGSLGVHDGVFHADEVTACALLLEFGLIKLDHVVRTRDPKKLKKCEYVCDVGGVYDPSQKLFDHHQEQYQGKLSSAGMVLGYLLEKGHLKPKEYNYLHESFVFSVDEHDNGRVPEIWGYCAFSNVVSSFVSPQYDVNAKDQDRDFLKAVNFVSGYLSRIRCKLKYIQDCRDVVIDTMTPRKECLLFEAGVPWMDTFFETGGLHHPAKFVIMPVGPHWKLRGIPPNYEDRMKVRVPLPKEWAGLLDDELVRVSKIEGAVFCHKGRFVSVWKSREAALRALEYTLQNAGNETNSIS